MPNTEKGLNKSNVCFYVPFFLSSTSPFLCFILSVLSLSSSPSLPPSPFLHPPPLLPPPPLLLPLPPFPSLPLPPLLLLKRGAPFKMNDPFSKCEYWRWQGVQRKEDENNTVPLWPQGISLCRNFSFCTESLGEVGCLSIRKQNQGTFALGSLTDHPV